MKKKYFLISAFIIIILITLLLITSKKSVPNKIKIGVVIPQTGNLAFIGDQIKNGIELALNDKKDTTIRVIYEDSKGNSRDGVSAVKKLLSIDNVDYIIVNLTRVAMASVPLINKSNSVGFFLSTHPSILDNIDNGFRIFTSGKQEGDLISRYIIDSTKIKKISCIYVNDSYGEGTVNYIRNIINKDISVLDIAQYDFTNPNFLPLVSKSKQLGAEGILLIGYGFEYEQFLEKLNQIKYYPTIFSNFSFANKEGLEINKYKKNKIVFTAPIFEDSTMYSSTISDFIKKYKSKYNSLPDFNAAYGYDNIKIIIDAIYNSDNVINYLKDNYSYEGATGKISIASNGDTNTEMEIVIR